MRLTKVLLMWQLVPLLLQLSQASKESEIRNSLLTEYDRLIPPSEFGSRQPLNVSVNMFLSKLGPFNQADMTLAVRAIIRMSWMDPRLAFIDDEVTSLKLPGSFRENIWVPDMYSPEAKSFQVASNVKENSFVRISAAHGTVLMSIDAQIEAACPINWQAFPFDTQSCSLLFESYGHTTSTLVLHWTSSHPVDHSMSTLQLKQFKVTDIRTLSYTLHFASGSYSDLEVQFVLERSCLDQLYSLFFPAVVIVFISCVALWVPRKDTNLRLSIGVAALLSMLVVCNMANAAKHGVSAVSFADFYLLCCCLFVLGSLAACIAQSLCCTCDPSASNEGEDEKEESFSDLSSQATKSSSSKVIPMCDKVVGTLFPAGFILMNIILLFCHI